MKMLEEETQVDPTKMFVFGKDFTRIDLGLIISRPAIFMHMHDRDIEFMKARADIMNEFHCDHKKYIEEFEEVSKLNEHVLSGNPYSNDKNLDNYPTHKYTDPSSGETQEYAAASKNFTKVDPETKDTKSIHYAPGDATYLILKNKFTDEWEFPTSNMFFGQSFLRVKQNLFVNLTGNKWKIKYNGTMPQVHSLRRLTIAEQEDPRNEGLKGVRTYYFFAHHLRGLPEMSINEEMPYNDFAWVPKRQMNEFFTKEYYEVFIHALRTR